MKGENKPLSQLRLVCLMLYRVQKTSVISTRLLPRKPIKKRVNRLKITYNVQAPDRRGFAKSEEVKAIEDFLTSGNAKNMCFEYDTKEEAKNKLATISGHKRKYNEQHPKGYDAYRVDKCIYVIRGAKAK